MNKNRSKDRCSPARQREIKPPSPPRSAENLLARIHSDRGRFTHLGDFEEVFREILRTRGPARACLWYRMQVLKSIPGFLTNRLYWSLAMLKNYLTLAVRNLLKNRGFSLLNLAGLAVGGACFLLIAAHVRHELSFDRFLPEHQRIFRLLSRETSEANTRSASEMGDHFPEVIGPMLEAEIPEIEAVTRFMPAFGKPAVLQAGENFFTQTGLYADHRFLEILEYPLIKGRPEEVLDTPGAVVLTASVARKLFGDNDPIGRTVAYRELRREYDLTVTGILEDLPDNSSLRFDYLLSLKTVRADKLNAFMFDNMKVGNFYIFVKLAGSAVRTAVEAKLLAFARSKDVEDIEILLQPVADIHLHSRIVRQRETNDLIRQLYIYASIALVILLVACINAMNLATARFTTRAREIGIRKVTGAGRRQLIQQFFGESLLLAAAAMAAALFLAVVFLPGFRRLTGSELPGRLLRDPQLLLVVLAATLFVGLASGSYPAFFLSSLQPVVSLRQATSGPGGGGRLRNVLVVVQFAASILLITATMVIAWQMRFIKTRNLGFDREHVVVIPIREMETSRNRGAIRTAFLQLPQVEGVSISSGLPIQIRSRMLNFKLEKENGEILATDLRFDYVDENFLDVFKINLAQGRNFSRDFSTDEDGILVNQALVDLMGWKEPLGRLIPRFFDEGNFHIIGVVGNFHYSTFHTTIEPMALVYLPGSNICVRIRPGDPVKTVAALKKAFQAGSPGQPFDYYFLDDAFDRLYQKELRTGKIFGAFAGLTVLVACLGLFSLAAFAVERRTKEIGIRKILGASPVSLAGRLSGHFARLVLIANLIAWPPAYLFIRRWLQDFAYRIEIGIGPFLLAGGAALMIAFLTISWHTFRAASSNPVDTLRYE